MDRVKGQKDGVGKGLGGEETMPAALQQHLCGVPGTCVGCDLTRLSGS